MAQQERLPLREQRLKETIEAILSLEAPTVREIANHTGMSVAATYKRVIDAEKAGLIERRGGRIIRVTPSGMTYTDAKYPAAVIRLFDGGEIGGTVVMIRTGGIEKKVYSGKSTGEIISYLTGG